MRRERPVGPAADVFQEIERSGYYPEIVTAGLRDALAGEDVLAHVVHHEPTFERDEIRRHMTVLVMTPLMTYVLLPWITRQMSWWLQGKPAPWRR